MRSAYAEIPVTAKPVSHDSPSVVVINGPSLADTVKLSLAAALEGRGKLDDSVLSIEGMSGIKYRYFINNLIGALDNPRYLEVGAWSGSTLCAAIFGNKVDATVIDNWSEFGGPISTFFGNVSRCCSPTTRLTIITEDFRKALQQKIPGLFNVYLFDGPHEYQDQYDGLSLALPFLTDEFVFIVDDWNWEAVRNGTRDAISACGLQVKTTIEIRTTDDNSHPTVAGRNSDWHNGYCISVLGKPPS